MADSATTLYIPVAGGHDAGMETQTTRQEDSMTATATLAWTKGTDHDSGATVYTRGRYQIIRHEEDNTWDSGALVPFEIQWVRSERMNDGTWQPVEIHSRLRDAKAAAERWEK